MRRVARRERIRVVQVINSLAPAGAETGTVELARRLDAERFDSSVVVVRDGVLRSGLEQAGIPLAVVGGGFDWRAPLTVSRIRRELRRIRPHIVHTHLIGGDVVGRTAARLAGVPVVVSTQHDTYERRGVLALFRRLTASWVDAVIACSSSVVPYCSSELHMPEERTVMIENGIDVESMRVPRRPGGAFTFGTLGSLVPAKGHEVALRAFAQVAEACSDARLELAGDGTLRGELEALAARLGISKRVEFLGHVTDIPSYLARIDVLVHPSLQEGLPLAVLEAMAAPRPVIASDLPAIRDALDGGEAGTLVPHGDADALAAAMHDACSGALDLDALARAAADRVARRYSVERMVRDYGDLYERLAAEKGLV